MSDDRAELIERCREAFEDAGDLALEVFDNDEESEAFRAHCQNMIGGLDDLIAGPPPAPSAERQEKASAAMQKFLNEPVKVGAKKRR